VPAARERQSRNTPALGVGLEGVDDLLALLGLAGEQVRLDAALARSRFREC
jgi:hypothetical protein